VTDLAALLRKLRRDGYTVTKGRSGHYKVRDASGRLVAVTSSTPSDHRGLRNLEGDLRRRAGAGG
jgi:hypothetical protein